MNFKGTLIYYCDDHKKAMIKLFKRLGWYKNYNQESGDYEIYVPKEDIDIYRGFSDADII